MDISLNDDQTLLRETARAFAKAALTPDRIRPLEETETLTQDDPTWVAEYAHFKALCATGGPSGFDNDIWIGRTLDALAHEAAA